MGNLHLKMLVTGAQSFNFPLELKGGLKVRQENVCKIISQQKEYFVSFSKDGV